MSFPAALDRLAALGAELAAPNAPRRKFDLAHMRTLVRALGDPQTRFRSILIAGTNGKGSTAATLAHILAAAGLRTALYTSPHLIRVTERIRTNTPPLVIPEGDLLLAPSNTLSFRPERSGVEKPASPAPAPAEGRHSGATLQNLRISEPLTESSFRPERSEAEKPASAPAQGSGETLPPALAEIPEPTFARLFFQVDETAQRLVSAGDLPHPPSYFETLTALAFLYFAEQRIDLAVLEVGLGGRLDATNIVAPLISILTDIALDHQDYLGPTIRDIAREKAGILRPNGILITLPQHPEANQSIGEAAVPLNVRAINAADYLPGRNFPLPSQAVPNHTEPVSSHAVSFRPERSEVEKPASAPAQADATTNVSFRPEAEGRSGETRISAPAQAGPGTTNVSFRPEAEGRSGETGISAPAQARPGTTNVSFRPERSEVEKPASAPAQAPGAPFTTQPHRVVGGEEPGPTRLIQPTTPLPQNTYILHLEGQPLHISSPLPGEHQQRNLALAIAAAVELRTHHGYTIPNSAIESGIANTRWPGRLEFLPPNLLLDVAHNPAGAWTLRAALSTLPDTQPRTLLFSCLRDKDLREIAQILFPLFDSPPVPASPPAPESPAAPESRHSGATLQNLRIPAPAHAEPAEKSVSFRPERSAVEKPASPAPAHPRGPQHHIILTPIDNPRAATLAQLTATAAALDIPALTAPNPAEALALARSVTPPNGLIVATGSIYLIGTLRALVT